MRDIKLACILSVYLINKVNKVNKLDKLDKQNGGGNYRKIIVYGTDKELESFSNYKDKYKKDLEERNVKIIYKKSPKFFVELYGYDQKLKKSIYKQDLDTLIKTIDLMPMGRIEKDIRKIT